MRLSKKYKKKPPKSTPPVGGKNDHTPKIGWDRDIEGIISEKTEADTITPEAKPSKTAFNFSGISPLKRKTTAEPNAVIKKMKNAPMNKNNQLCILFHRTSFVDFPTLSYAVEIFFATKNFPYSPFPERDLNYIG